MKNLIAANSDKTLELKSSGGDFSGLTTLNLPNIISAFIKLSMVVAALIFFFMLIIGGIRWIASGGDKGQTEAARNQITAALVGLVIVFAAWAIVNLISVFFPGINIFTLSIPTIGQ